MLRRKIERNKRKTTVRFEFLAATDYTEIGVQLKTTHSIEKASAQAQTQHHHHYCHHYLHEPQHKTRDNNTASI